MSRPDLPRVGDSLEERLSRATLGTYEIRGEIGRGGMAAVFFAHDMRMGRKVAIKVLLPELGHRTDMVERFRREARTSAQLLHPNIIVIHSVEERDGLHFFVMSLVQGLSLAQLLHAPTTAGHGVLPLPLVQSLVLQTARALLYAHGERVVHRDVSPSNVMVNVRGDAIVTDFGIAKAAEEPQLTQAGDTIGTPAYMSPEQCRGNEVTPASDQYSLGVLIYELLAGHVPFTASNYYALMLMHVTEPPPSLAQKRPDLPLPLVHAVERMLAKTPEERWPTLREALPALATGFDEHDETARRTLAELVAAAGPVDRSRFAATPVTPLRGTAHLSQPDLRDVPGQELEVGASVGPSAEYLASVGDRVSGWWSGDPRVATVTADGTVTAVATGRAAIYVELRTGRPGPGERRPVCVVTVTRPRVAAVRVSPETIELPVGEELTMAAEALDGRGSVLHGRTVRWESTNPAFVTVDESGKVRAVAPGRAGVTASCEECVGTAAVVVTGAKSERVAQLRISASTTTPRCGDRTVLTADALDDRGAVLRDRVATWVVSPATAASIEPLGKSSATLVARDAGLLTVTATCGGVESRIELTAQAVVSVAPDVADAPDTPDESEAPAALPLDVAATEDAEEAQPLTIDPPSQSSARPRWLLPVGAAVGVVVVALAVGVPRWQAAKQAEVKRVADSTQAAQAAAVAAETARAAAADSATRLAQLANDSVKAQQDSVIEAARLDSLQKDAAARKIALVPVRAEIKLPLSAPSGGTIRVGESWALHVNLLDSAGRKIGQRDGNRVTWSSDNPAVLSIENGVAHAHKPGAVFVAATVNGLPANPRQLVVTPQVGTVHNPSAGSTGPAPTVTGLAAQEDADRAVDALAQTLQASGNAEVLGSGEDANGAKFRKALLDWLDGGNNTRVQREGPATVRIEPAGPAVVSFRLGATHRRTKKVGFVKVSKVDERIGVNARGVLARDGSGEWKLRSVVLTDMPR